MPQSLGGSNHPDNLALACHRCNERHYNFTSGFDPQTQAEIRFFRTYYAKLPWTTPQILA